MLNIVIPMAGAGSRFAKEGYADPKPLIPVHGQPMIKVVINNLRPSRDHRFIFICQRAHVAAYGLKEKLSAWAPGWQPDGGRARDASRHERPATCAGGRPSP